MQEDDAARCRQKRVREQLAGYTPMKLRCITSLAMRKKAASTLVLVSAETTKNDIWDMVLVGAGGKGGGAGEGGTWCSSASCCPRARWIFLAVSGR